MTDAGGWIYPRFHEFQRWLGALPCAAQTHLASAEKDGAVICSLLVTFRQTKTEAEATDRRGDCLAIARKFLSTLGKGRKVIIRDAPEWSMEVDFFHNDDLLTRAYVRATVFPEPGEWTEEPSREDQYYGRFRSAPPGSISVA